MIHNPIIRKAVAGDGIVVAHLLVQAMGDLALFFTSNSAYNEQVRLFEMFFLQNDNQYSFENTFVYEEAGKVLGSVNGYDGGRLKELRSSFFRYVEAEYHVQIPACDDETEAGEFYIDCVSVLPEMQGKGIGKRLLTAMIEKGIEQGFKKVGLLVDCHNPDAKRLYTQIGFHKVGDKFFMNGKYEHLQFDCPTLQI